jgi:hypothetical protein
MAPRCFPPGEILDSGRSRQAFGEFVERIVQKDYCDTLAQQGLGTCALFIPPSLGGARSEFFDEAAGVSRCALLASYLKFHNGHVNEQTIVSQCQATNPKPLRVKVPDIISHRFARTEFYEIKPNSPSGIQGGAEKIAWFSTLCNPMVANLPYTAGTQYKPNFTFVLSNGNALGGGFQVGVHVFWALPGLILYELCPVTSRPRQEEKCTALMRAAELAAIVRLRSDPFTASAALSGLVGLAESPLQGAVGRASGAGPAPNLAADVLYVQLLLNDWRARNGLSLIGEDGLWGNQTDGAVIAFQQAVTGIADGRIDVGGPAIRALESGHLQAALDAALSALNAAELPAVEDPTIFHDTDADEDVAGADDPITPADVLLALQEEMRGYLRMLY